MASPEEAAITRNGRKSERDFSLARRIMLHCDAKPGIPGLLCGCGPGFEICHAG
jgi:hypothetical protein